MNIYLSERYGDPCRGCGYDWSIDAKAAAGLVQAMADRYTEVLAHCDGRERHVDLTWDASSYVCHAADNNRIWAERVAAAALGYTGSVAPYDEDELAAARAYGRLPLLGALWSLRRSVEEWQTASALAGGTTVLHHPEQGQLRLDDVTRILGHEAYHHAADLERIAGREDGSPPRTMRR